ncbi:FAD-binding oxidoreductase [Gordonia shandongensis]|uniref:FAD-binding oxidoreductase n=1 Tax=Gordonia shandongensis TaxID=376351 RepID=UPI00041D8635|nr:FAD-binding oxidoreductase [Gordonia shandongensis]
MTEPGQPILAQARSLIAADPDRFARSVFARLFALQPRLRELFPVEMAELRSVFVDVIDHVLDAIPASGGHDELVDFLAQLGRDHRKYGVLGEHYWLMYEALMSEFEYVFGDRWTPETTETVSQAMQLTTGVMRGAADSVTDPARWTARVVQKFTINRERAVVRLVVDGEAPPFAAGQYLETQIPQWPRVWRNFSPAIPPNDDGHLEFHVRAVQGGRLSPTIVRDTTVGDVWTFGQRHGTMRVDPDRPVLMIAGGSGLAPLRALLLDLATNADAPATHIFYGTRYPGELYELGVLHQLARSNPWLRVTAVSEETEDPWWITGAADPRQWGTELVYGRVGEVAARYRDWTDRQVLICGPSPMVFHTALQLRAAGVPGDAISHDPLD